MIADRTHGPSLFGAVCAWRRPPATKQGRPWRTGRTGCGAGEHGGKWRLPLSGRWRSQAMNGCFRHVSRLWAATIILADRPSCLTLSTSVYSRGATNNRSCRAGHVSGAPSSDKVSRHDPSAALPATPRKMLSAMPPLPTNCVFMPSCLNRLVRSTAWLSRPAKYRRSAFAALMFASCALNSTAFSCRCTVIEARPPARRHRGRRSRAWPRLLPESAHSFV